MILHTVNKSPYSSQCLSDCLPRVAPGDAVLLIEDGVYGINCAVSLSMTPVNETILRLRETQVRFYVLREDIKARGLDDHLKGSLFKPVDYEGFVDLVGNADKVLSWY